ncbi:alanyl-tRNA editing protein [Candidatus Woesearchaeota archaeon]|nr:alanyl-tRNA editing protein [Candidatus Woesearchaeota archaeon]
MEALYLKDSNIKEFEATVESVKDDKFVVLDQTAFYPEGGGQPFDTGKIIRINDNEEFPVIYVGKFDGKISHQISTPGLKPGDKIKGILDWGRRYTLMRYHTCAHIISGVFNKEAGALITGGGFTLEKGRIDFNLDDFDREKISDYFASANKIVEDAHPIEVYTLPREEALEMPEMFKLKNVLPPSVENIRIVDIKDFDRQADGGTHVSNTSEVGKIEFIKADNKGKNNRRVYFKVS